MTYPTREAMNALNRALDLPATGREQDWDIELADAARVGEFVAFLETHALSDDERIALMALSLGSLEDLAQKQAIPPKLAEKFRRLLRSDVDLYAELIESWGPKGTDPEGFAISALVGSVKRAAQQLAASPNH